MQWQTKGSGKSKQHSFLQMAIEGAVVNALGLSDFGNAKKAGKGAGKSGLSNSFSSSNAGKDPLAGKHGGKGQFCQWEPCRAARAKQTTWGGGPKCHCCARLFSKPPPLESMVQWAYNDALAERKNSGAEPKAKAKAKAKANVKPQADANPKGSASTAELQELRRVRLAEMEAAKTAGAGAVHVTISDEVFGEKKVVTHNAVAVDLITASQALVTNARAVVTSL